MIANPPVRKHHGSGLRPILQLLQRLWSEHPGSENDLALWAEDLSAAHERSGLASMNSIVALNAKNQFQGKIKRVIAGPVVSEILIDTPAGVISSVITTSSALELGLQPGVPVLALFKATEVSIVQPATQESAHDAR